MFENPGRKIKVFAIIMFILVLVVAIFALIEELNSRYPDTSIIITCITAPIGQWIVSLFLNAFGELVENSSKIASSLENSSGKKQESVVKKTFADNTVSLNYRFVCSACNTPSTGWYQKCPSCGAIGKMDKL